jgi:hypothetical protein
MKRFMIPRVVHCSEGCTQVPGKTQNCPTNLRKKG